MTRENKAQPLSGEEIVALTKKHTLYEWSAQSKVDPIPVARAKGIYFWTPEGKRFIDFNSQLMCVNIGHGDERVVRAIQRAGGDAGLRQPVHGDRAARAARARSSPRSRPATSTSSSSPTAAPRRTRTRSSWRGCSPAATRSSPATARTTAARPAAITLTGDPRRWAAEPGMPGVVHVLDPYHGIAARLGRRGDSRSRCSRRVIQLEGPQTIAAFILETVTGTNGILVPPDGYLQGVRELCTGTASC